MGRYAAADRAYERHCRSRSKHQLESRRSVNRWLQAELGPSTAPATRFKGRSERNRPFACLVLTDSLTLVAASCRRSFDIVGQPWQVTSACQDRGKECWRHS